MKNNSYQKVQKMLFDDIQMRHYYLTTPMMTELLYDIFSKEFCGRQSGSLWYYGKAAVRLELYNMPDENNYE